MSIQIKNLPEDTEELMQYILERVCALTGNVKPSVAVNYIGRNRTLMYPYKRAVSDLRDVNAQFRVDCNMVYESTFDHFDCDYGRT